jgi:DNA-binding transcriptional regulator of glucitol operon
MLAAGRPGKGAAGRANLVCVRRFLTPRWLVRHAAMVLLVVAFLVLGWWQIGRARGGNALSFGYAIEWPAFAIFVIFVWYREIRNERGARPEPVAIVEPVLVRARDTAPVAAGVVEPAGQQVDSDPELDEYNRLLTWLAENPGSRPADYRRANPTA